jgi:hypothetical protein
MAEGRAMEGDRGHHADVNETSWSRTINRRRRLEGLKLAAGRGRTALSLATAPNPFAAQ